MNCKDWEERIALYVGGDLPAVQMAEVERHLGDCASCQLLASGLRQGLGALREAHEEPLEAAYFAAVRARVLSEVERERRPAWRRAWVYGLAAALVLLAMWVGRPKHQDGPPRADERLVATAGPPPPIPPAFREAPVVRKRRVHRKPQLSPVLRMRPAGTEAKQSLMVKLATDDPSVVIYWIAETRGE